MSNRLQTPTCFLSSLCRACSLLLPLAALVACAAGCADKNKGDAGGSVKASDREAAEVVLDSSAFTRLWINPVSLSHGDSIDRLYAAEDLVFAITPGNVVYALKRTSGVLAFLNEVDGMGRPIGPPVVVGSKVVIPANTSLQVYKRLNGEFDHTIPVEFSLGSGAVGSAESNAVYVGADVGGGRLAEISVANPYHPVTWTLMMFGEVLGAPAYYQGVVFCGSGDGGVRAINEDRRSIWALDGDKFDTGGAIVADVKVDDAGVYAASTSGRLVCIDRGNGRLKWQYFGSHELTASPVVTKATVYQLAPQIGMIAIDKTKQVPLGSDSKHTVDQQNRTPRWTSASAAQFLSEDEHYSYVRTVDNAIEALDKITGKIRYQSATPFKAFVTNTMDSTIYAATGDGRIYAFKPTVKPGVPGYTDTE